MHCVVTLNESNFNQLVVLDLACSHSDWVANSIVTLPGMSFGSFRFTASINSIHIV